MKRKRYRYMHNSWFNKEQCVAVGYLRGKNNLKDKDIFIRVEVPDNMEFTVFPNGLQTVVNSFRCHIRIKEMNPKIMVRNKRGKLVVDRKLTEEFLKGKTFDYIKTLWESNK